MQRQRPGIKSRGYIFPDKIPVFAGQAFLGIIPEKTILQAPSPDIFQRLLSDVA
jgi:hypothetical protein